MKKPVLQNFSLLCRICWNNKDAARCNIHFTKAGVAVIECFTCGTKEYVGIPDGSSKTELRDYEESTKRKIRES